MKTILINIKKLLQVDDSLIQWASGVNMGVLPFLDDAFLVMESGLIVEFGLMQNFNGNIYTDFKIIDCTDRMVLPTYCDSHTHIVYAQSRELEFVDRIKGLSYEEIAQRGGGILNSAKKIAVASEQELFEGAMERLDEVSLLGTGAIEIKSGYGLDPANELKMLRVIKRLKNESKLTIKATFLGAHAIPIIYKKNPTAYVDIIINEMMPEIAKESLADFVDVFCDKGFFSVSDTERILEAGLCFGLRAKIHANELGLTGGVQVGVKHNALSVDHLEYVGDEEIDCLLHSKTMPTVLPGAAFFLQMPYSPVRKMISKGLPIALASDYNPGSSPSGNMNFMMAMACINYKMTPEEAINAVTINGAYAMGIEQTHGSIAKGKVANVMVTKPMQNYALIPYAYTSNLIEMVFLNGELNK